MAMNPYVGWAVTTLLSFFLNRSSKSSETSNEPDSLGTAPAELGTPVPVVMGRQLVKNPLTIYYGDFSARAYTETYSAHAQFNAWPLVLSLIATYISAAITGHQVTPAKVAPGARVTTSGGSGSVTGTTTATGATYKDDLTGPLLNALFMWLLSWLINGRNLKTTMQKGFKYYLGYQMLCCVSGTGTRLRGLYLNQQEVWTGDAAREDHQQSPLTISVDDDELFGGPDESGGFVGDIHVYLGGAQQPADPWMIDQMSVDSVQEELRGLTPAYRPFVSLVVPGAYIGKQASIPQTWLDLQWIPNRLGLGGIGDNDANPAEVIYEMVVNNEWGLGRDPGLVDTAALKAAGEKLRQEGRGVSVKITSREQVKSVIDKLCEHLDMVRYTNPVSGKLTFKLIRDDYKLDELPVIDATNCSAIDFSRTVWANSAGEIIAQYADSAALYDTSTVMVSDPAIIEMNGGDRNSQDMDFTYFTTAANAAWAADRELRQQGFPLASVELICNRRVQHLRHGDVFKLNWAPYGISGLVMRVSDIDLGDFVSGQITISAIEDVFGVGKTKYGANDSTSWTKPDTYPTGVQLFQYFEAPWELLQSKESYVYAAAVRPDNLTGKWNIWRRRDFTWEKTSGMTKWTPAGQLVGSIGEFGEMVDVVGFTVIDLGGIRDLASRSTESGIALARNGSRILMIDNEIMGWGTLSPLANGNYQVSNLIRATYDTVPVPHAAGATVYFLDYGHYGNVTTGGPVAPAGSAVSEAYNITTETAYAEEAFSDAKITDMTTVRRPERPTPPGRIRLTSHLHFAVSSLEQAAGNVALAWALRNKNAAYGCVSQEDVTGFYTGMAIEPVNGLETIIRAYLGTVMVHEETLSQTVTIPTEIDDNGDVIEGLQVVTTPTNWTYTWAQRCQDSLDFILETRIEITARLNGLESYQQQRRTFVWRPPYIADACATMYEAQLIMSRIWDNGKVIVSFPDATLNKTIPVADMPLIILGTAYDEEQEGAILAQNGAWVVPNGTALAITGDSSYSVVSLTNGYVALSYMMPEQPGSLAAYQYDGAVFRRIAVPVM
jgi:hypothetical protein